MQTAVQLHLQQLLSANLPDAAPVTLDVDTAVRLIKRIDAVDLHAHAYSFILNLTHGPLPPFDVLEFAYRHELQGVNMHVDDGGENSLGNSDGAGLARFKQQAARLNLTIHLETSHTDRAEIDRVVRIASALGVQNIRAYSRYEGALSEVMTPTIRQVHLKGAKRLKEGDGYGQLGVVQGLAEDETPYARMLYDLLLLGETEPQVICFALEQEVNYKVCWPNRNGWRNVSWRTNPQQRLPRPPSRSRFQSAKADFATVDANLFAG